MLKAGQRLTGNVAHSAGSSMIVAPSDTDLLSPDVGPGLEASFGGGGYTALQRSACCNGVGSRCSSLDGRESPMNCTPTAAIPSGAPRLRRSFTRYNELANAVLKEIAIPMPAVDLSSIRGHLWLRVAWWPHLNVKLDGAGTGHQCWKYETHRGPHEWWRRPRHERRDPSRHPQRPR